MRVQGWRTKEVFALIRERSIRAGQELMDDFVVLARAKCPSPDKPTHKMITRIPGSTIIRNIRFTPKRGRQKGKDVSFTARVWTGRIPGSLQRNISGSIPTFQAYRISLIEKRPFWRDWVREAPVEA